MEKNILYRKLDILSVMEACEDSSKDFILLFMPSNMGGTVGPDALGEQGSFAEGCDGEKKERAKWRRAYIDYADATFINRENYKVGGGSKIEEMVNEAIRERGLIVWNAYGIG